VILRIIVRVRCCAEVIIVILLVDRSCASPGARQLMGRKSSAAPSCHDLSRLQEISTKKSNGSVMEM
jgi:hypothetical protein